MDQLTNPTLLHCLGRTRKYEKYLPHDLPEKLRHFDCEWDIRIIFKTLEEEVNTLKEFGERIIARGDVLPRLGQRFHKCERKDDASGVPRGER
jgi:hypothetical protein